MRLRHPHQRRAERGGFAGVDGDADAAAADIARMHIVDAPLAADHDRQPRIEGRRVVQRALHVAAAGAVEQFKVAIDRIRDADGLGRPRIGGIGVAETALGALGPDRPRRCGGETAQHLGFFQQRLVPEVGFGEFPAQPAEFANPYNGLAADGAAHGLEGVSIRGGEIEQKALAGLAQRIDRMIHPQRRFRRQPGSEGQNALRLILRGIRRHQQRDVAADLRAIVARRPRDQDLRLGEQQRAETVGLDLQALDVGAQPRLVVGGADPGAHQQDRRHHRKAEQRQRRRQHRDFLTIEIEEGRNRMLDDGKSLASAGAIADQCGGAKARSGRCAPMMCTTARSDASTRSRPTWFAPNRTTLRMERTGASASRSFANRMTISSTGVGG